MQTFESKNENSNITALSVSELNKQIKRLLESEFPLVWVQAEISNFTAHSSGHYYFSLKDSSSNISAVMFRAYNSKLKFRPTNGMEIMVRARISVYEPRGSYQLMVEIMEPVGAGALQKAFEQLKVKLSLEGLTDAKRKRKLPVYPQKIALVTSPTGAAVKDMLNILRRRQPSVEVYIVPCLVQGESASKDILRAMKLAVSANAFDVIIVGRGGGSTEDLWAFNNEELARYIAACPVPVVSAVGHEIDFSISDFVADLRAPTPSAAAELVVKDRVELLEFIANKQNRIQMALNKKLQLQKRDVQLLNKRMINPQKFVEMQTMRADELSLRLQRSVLQNIQQQKMHLANCRAQLPDLRRVLKVFVQKWQQLEFLLAKNMDQNIKLKKMNLAKNASLLNSFSPLQVLERGYSIVKLEDEIISSSKQLKLNDSIEIRLHQGRIQAQVQALSTEN